MPAVPANRSSREFELRLVTTATAVRRLPRCAALRSLTVSSSRTQRLLSVYWDAPGLPLRASRLALRLRQVDGGRWIQTLKAETQVPHTRDEYEGPVFANRPDLKLAREC